jgi:hypothetical protein
MTGEAGSELPPAFFASAGNYLSDIRTIVSRIESCMRISLGPSKSVHAKSLDAPRSPAQSQADATIEDLTSISRRLDDVAYRMESELVGRDRLAQEAPTTVRSDR